MAIYVIDKKIYGVIADPMCLHIPMSLTYVSADEAHYQLQTM